MEGGKRQRLGEGGEKEVEKEEEEDEEWNKEGGFLIYDFCTCRCRITSSDTFVISN